VLEVAHEYKKLPLDVIVIDFFYCKKQGDWSFDNDYFPNSKAMIDEL
jgi:glycoside hydrolase family 31